MAHGRPGVPELVGKKAQKRRAERGKAKAGQPDDRHTDFGPAADLDPERMLERMLAASQPDTEGRKPHEWSMVLVFDMPGGEEEAHRLAELRRDDPEAYKAWVPTEAAQLLRVDGPQCLACHKIRGPLPAVTLCGERRPGWLQQRELDMDLRFMPRGERRELELKRRKQERRQLQKRLDTQLGPSPVGMAKAAHVNKRPPDPCKPAKVKLVDPDPWPPERVLFEAA